MTEHKKRIIKSVLKFLLGVFVLAIVLLGCGLALSYGFGFQLEDLKDQQKMQEFIQSTGPFGKFIFVLISFLQVTFVPIPGMVTILAGNYLFGFWDSLILSYIGMLIGGLFAFFLGRKIGRPFVNWVVGDKETVNKYLKKLKGKEIVLFFFMFLLPFFPDDLLCSIAGITSISWFAFLILQVITRFTSVMGTLLFMSGEFIPYEGWGVPVLIVLGILAGILFIISYKKSATINNFLESISQKISLKFTRKKVEKEDSTLNTEKEEKEEK